MWRPLAIWRSGLFIYGTILEVMEHQEYASDTDSMDIKWGTRKERRRVAGKMKSKQAERIFQRGLGFSRRLLSSA